MELSMAKINPNRMYRSKGRVLRQIDEKCWLSKEEKAVFKGEMTLLQFREKLMSIGINPYTQERINNK